MIYTRVSTKEQADNNMSLAVQRKICDEYAMKTKLEVMAFFGGTYESAKTDEREEFKRVRGVGGERWRFAEQAIRLELQGTPFNRCIFASGDKPLHCYCL